jgi:hypothetical protein
MQIEFGLLQRFNFHFFTIKDLCRNRFFHIELGFFFIQIRSWNKDKEKIQ